MSKSVLITGAAYGIGAATGKLFAKNGYDVIINYKNSAKDAEAALAACKAENVKAWASAS